MLKNRAVAFSSLTKYSSDDVSFVEGVHAFDILVTVPGSACESDFGATASG